jgi:hypothetical protein
VAGATALPGRDVSVEVLINGASFGTVTFEKAVAITAPTRADFKAAAVDEAFVFETDFDDIETVEVIYSRDAWTGRGGFDQNVFVRSVDVDGSVFSADAFAFYDSFGDDRNDGPGGDMFWRGAVLFDGLSDVIA